MFHFNFARGAYDTAAMPATYSIACRDRVPVTQEDTCISGDYNPAIGDFDYIGLCMTEPVSGDRTVTAHCAFKAAGAPLVVLADSITILEDGSRRFGPMYEIVAYAGGCNVWRILPDFDPADPARGYTVRSITMQSFPVADVASPDLTEVELEIRVEGKTLHIRQDDYTFSVDVPDLPERYYVGLTLCEGYNRFYDLCID